MSSSPPVIGFELGVGEFRIVTPEAIYQIKVLPELVTANMALGVVSPTLGAAPSHSPAHVAAAPVPSASNLGHSPNEQVFFQEISQELFEKVGQLARQLSVSVGEIPEVPQGDLSKTGADLENAKGQLEEVVELTEKASMTIMDLADQIQLDMDSLNSQMTSLTNLEFLLEGEAGKSNLAGSVISSPAAAALPVDFLAKLGELKNYLARFVATAQAPSESPL
ncbi:MAG: protein phosphatase CheZ, partial [Deltaproteobacteria bacterium]|nr:protein phosphatase CheZ [Deltaproteobacteria bacterium]